MSMSWGVRWDMVNRKKRIESHRTAVRDIQTPIHHPRFAWALATIRQTAADFDAGYEPPGIKVSVFHA